ncbi:hypothetical protein [Aeromonas veronii]|uniref:hypothetical protein n=1 Tax=Aeromonas veronii TaxID=654 RepID=UPI003D263CFE
MKIEDLIKKISDNSYNEKQLINIYKNAISNTELNESDKKLVFNAIEKNTRLRFPKAAKRIFGAKESTATKKLEALNSMLEKEFNLTRNRLKNGVKAGGYMISGQFYIDVYMSYKNDANHAAAIGLTQLDIDAELEVTVKRYTTYGENPGIIESCTTTMDNFEACANTYRAHLAKIIA